MKKTSNKNGEIVKKKEKIRRKSCLNTLMNTVYNIAMVLKIIVTLIPA